MLIAALVGGLAYLRFKPDADPVSVHAGAHAGDLILKPCTYATDGGRYRADCGTLVVPENRSDAGSRLIALPVKRIRARSDHPAEPIFRLEGCMCSAASDARASRRCGRCTRSSSASADGSSAPSSC